MAAPLSTLPFIDYDDTEYAQHPFEWLSEKANQSKMARSFRGVDLLDYNLCRQLFMNRDLGNGHLDLVELIGIPEHSQAMRFKRSALDGLNRGETRTRLRQTMLQLMGPSQADVLRASISRVVRDLIKDLPTDGVVDLRADFADLLPGRVFCSWLDVPMTDDRLIMEMSESTLSLFSRDPETSRKVVDGFDTIFAYVREKIAMRRTFLGEDLLSGFIRAQLNGAISEDELEIILVMLIEGSSDNTAHQVAIAVDRLTTIPGLWKRLGDQPELVPAAVRETMRLWPRSISTTRKALIDTEIDGFAIPQGTNVFACFGAAQRQADIFDDPHSFRLDRNGPQQHMNFGGGVFSCIGQFVAVIETEEAVAQLAQRFPQLRVTRQKREFTAMFHSVPELAVQLNG
ncbi:cytochrome P450 [Rhizobium sp. G187]|uniref:cytochrome P450 n=1 Tax=Rhizobium sp. G187 TaxID=3451352 RepID=UPI003EE561A4